jgi:hypothetical protein
MRALIVCAILVGVIGHSTAFAQAPGTQTAESAMNFSGTYVRGGPVDVSSYTQPDVYPFTAEGERGYRAYVDPRRVDDCAVPGFPELLFYGYPMQIDQEDGGIVIRHESGNTTRFIHMDGASPPAGQAHTETGYSTGRWEGTELRIETTHLLEGQLTNRGQPVSREARVTERYWRNPGEQDLQLEVDVDDPVNYTQTVTLGREFVWSADEQLRQWECVSLGQRDTAPDLDEVARMLEEL